MFYGICSLHSGKVLTKSGHWHRNQSWCINVFLRDWIFTGDPWANASMCYYDWYYCLLNGLLKFDAGISRHLEFIIRVIDWLLAPSGFFKIRFVQKQRREGIVFLVHAHSLCLWGVSIYDVRKIFGFPPLSELYVQCPCSGWPTGSWKKLSSSQAQLAEPGNMLGCCLTSFHFLWAILSIG